MSVLQLQYEQLSFGFDEPTKNESMKKCSKCLENLPDENFSPSSGGSYLRPECKKCASILSKERRLLKLKYGSPDEEHQCPICLKNKEDISGAGGKRQKTSWVIDHDHKTKKFRGFLCHNCNRAIGCFGDNIDTLWRAIEYLMNKDIDNEDQDS